MSALKILRKSLTNTNSMLNKPKTYSSMSKWFEKKKQNYTVEWRAQCGCFFFLLLLLLLLLECSYVFWFGDLNFRLIGEDEPNHIKELVEQDKLDELIERDQLSMIRRQGSAFTRLEERLPAFPPTFKFEHGTSDYDMKLVEIMVYFICLAHFNHLFFSHF